VPRNERKRTMLVAGMKMGEQKQQQAQAQAQQQAAVEQHGRRCSPGSPASAAPPLGGVDAGSRNSQTSTNRGIITDESLAARRRRWVFNSSFFLKSLFT
jgi:hypothetical protein